MCWRLVGSWHERARNCAKICFMWPILICFAMKLSTFLWLSKTPSCEGKHPMFVSRTLFSKCLVVYFLSISSFFSLFSSHFFLILLLFDLMNSSSEAVCKPSIPLLGTDLVLDSTSARSEAWKQHEFPVKHGSTCATSFRSKVCWRFSCGSSRLVWSGGIFQLWLLLLHLLRSWSASSTVLGRIHCHSLMRRAFYFYAIVVEYAFELLANRWTSQWFILHEQFW